MRKFQHIVKGSGSGGYPTACIFVDTESTARELGDESVEHSLRLGVAEYVVYNGGGRVLYDASLRFDNVERFWYWAITRLYMRRRTYLIAHNLEFDWVLLDGFRRLGKEGFVGRKFISGNGKLIMVFRKGSATLVALDSMNYFHCSLKKLGEWVGVAKWDIPEMLESDEKWSAYCANDVRVLRAAWEKWGEFLREHDCGSFANTIAGQAWNCYRRRFMTKTLYVHDRKRVTELERQSYRGGRSECFRIGDFSGEDFYLLDVTSHYPAMMAKYYYPVKFLYRLEDPPLQEVSNLLYDTQLIARCRLTTDLPVYGIKRDGLLIYPVGEFDAVLCTPEIYYALKRGHLLRCYELAVYESEDIFRAYIQYWWQQRKAAVAVGDEAGESFCKLMMNSLFGRFGLRVQKWEKVGDSDSHAWAQWFEYDSDQDEVIMRRRWAGREERLMGWFEGIDSMPAVSAHVTAYGRMRMWEIIEKVGCDNVYYCDTDSVIVNSEGKKRLADEIVEGEIGKLRVQDSADRIYVYGIKYYQVGKVESCAGRKLSDIEFAPGIFKSFQQVGFSSRATFLPPDKVYWQRVVKRARRPYRHGVVDVGGRVLPFRLMPSNQD